MRGVVHYTCVHGVDEWVSFIYYASVLNVFSMYMLAISIWKIL